MVIGEGPELVSRAKFQDETFHIGTQKGSCCRRMGSVLKNDMDMGNELG